MAKEEMVEMRGVVTQAFPNAYFQVKLENGHDALCHAGGRIRKHYIKILMGDEVIVELSPYDLTRGRITYRER